MRATRALGFGLVLLFLGKSAGSSEEILQGSAARTDTIGCGEDLPELNLPVTAATEMDGKPYRIIGRVFVRKMGTTTFSRPSVRSLVPRLVKQAGSMHPDAILGLHTGTQGTLDGGERYRWVSGMAVVIDSTAEGSNRRFREDVIAIPPVQIADSLIRNADKRERASAWLQLGIAYHLEELGYYTATYATGLAPKGVEELKAMDDEAFVRAFGPWTGKVLLLSLDYKSSVNIGVAAGHGADLHGVVYDRRTRQVIWNGSSEGTSFELDPLSALLGSGYRRSLYNATAALTKRFPARGE
jgi:hypothetical protein